MRRGGGMLYLGMFSDPQEAGKMFDRAVVKFGLQPRGLNFRVEVNFISVLQGPARGSKPQHVPLSALAC